MESLSGVHIVVTRPKAQSEPWALQLAELGARTTIIPLLDIVPVTQAAQIQAIKNCILGLDQYHKAIFVSQNAVEQGFDWIENYWPQLPMAVEFFAVGDTTAQSLRRRGVRVTDLAQTQTGAMTSETLLQSPALQQVAGDKVVIFRGLGGRPHLGQELSARGARVDYCELYERQLPAAAAQMLKEIELHRAELPIMVLHSGEALENLHRVWTHTASLGPMDPQFSLLVPSQRLAEQARALGGMRVFAAQNATAAAMLQGLIDIKHTLIRGMKL